MGAADGSRKRTRGLLLLLTLAVAILLYNALFSFSYSVGPNYRNVSIDTRVNITNAAPEILSVTLPASVTLVAGSTQLIECNVSVRDFNGWEDLNYTRAVFYHLSSSPGAADDNNTHYTNGSCIQVSTNGDYANYTCGFLVYYYALNGTWTCNATVYDNRSFNDSELNTTTINQLLALNVTPLIDYGDMAIGETSPNRTANVTNIGNVDIRVAVKGYGQTMNDGLAFVCQEGNISITNQKYSVNNTDDYGAKTSLTSSFQNIGFPSIPKQNDPSTMQTNTSYWQLYVPPNPFGQCNGTIIFQAEEADWTPG